MSNIRLSVIVPVFRVEQYLDQCVQSLLHQDLRAEEYEIILVDDGSDDNSPVLCDQYAAQYEQIRVIHQTNKGQAAARNSGIKAAQGQYICFVDSDDFLEPNTYKPLLKQAIYNTLDILQFRVQLVSGNKITPIGVPHNDNTVYSGEQFVNTCLNVQCYPVIYLIRRNLLTDSSVYFTEGIFYEDVEWVPRMLYAADRVMRNDVIVYNYVMHPNSTTHPTTKEKWQRVVEDNLTVLNHYSHMIAERKETEWLRAMSASIITAILTIVAKQFYTERNTYIKQIQTIYPYTLESKANFPLTEKIKTYLAHISPDLYCFIRHYL